MATQNGGQQDAKPLHIVTPLLHSAPLTKLASAQTGRNVQVFLKMDALQPSGSFKVRGLGNTIDKAARRAAEAAQNSGLSTSNGASSTSSSPLTVISSSGGNAGLAAAYCARMRGLPCFIFVPTTTEDFVVDLMRAENADVTVSGDAWDDCDVAAKAFQQQQEQRRRATIYVHPFLGEDTIEGHATVIEEMSAQLQEAGMKPCPDAIICSAGGAGLVRGIMRPYLREPRRQNPMLLVTQCFGADSFTQSVLAARKKPIRRDGKISPVTLPAITSKATSMGARTCSVEAIRDVLQYPDMSPIVMDDGLAASAAWKLARDHRIIVELACSAALAPVYFAERLLKPLIEMQRAWFKTSGDADNPFVVVVEVCGGNKTSAAMIEAWRREEESQPPGAMAALRATWHGDPV